MAKPTKTTKTVVVCNSNDPDKRPLKAATWEKEDEPCLKIEDVKSGPNAGKCVATVQDG
jgi:hypothetical protein